ncbi:superoxide dismutase family protein [Geodermatophilus sp. DSM 45219]|uniref:superoxide dismutase family protein n=1 Tax=Geodermatophilus sp. DSM 45219 TaxID=1881103 RepID=UPI0008829F1D|nr:superoxide dismutase family protein [Geodermatophilus sp. DSM 45219]SDN75514.1 superoxide dismutase, Cu-Zn family [Geodermatophilus sp. DSM 45219]
MRRPVVPTVLSACALAAAVGGCAGDEEAPSASSGGVSAAADSPPAGAGGLTARLVDPEGGEVGVATLSEADGGTRVEVEVTGLAPGFHGFHLHAVGLCEPDSPSPTDPSMTGDFLSAGGHIGAGETDHGDHPGDLPVLYVTEAGTGTLTAVTDALTLDQLDDEDGSAVMVHADRDNYANVPERYAPGGPDQMTRNTGDAGGRIACGPVEG